jgi:hypothetical protein
LFLQDSQSIDTEDTVMRRTLSAAAVAVALAAAACASSPEVAPTAQERTQIETALRNGGYSRWEGIKLQGGAWAVDDARSSDGRTYDLRLDRNTMAVIGKEVD